MTQSENMSNPIDMKPPTRRHVALRTSHIRTPRVVCKETWTRHALMEDQRGKSFRGAPSKLPMVKSLLKSSPARYPYTHLLSPSFRAWTAVHKTQKNIASTQPVGSCCITHLPSHQNLTTNFTLTGVICFIHNEKQQSICIDCLVSPVLSP
jgi:hypothetical protein